MAFVLLSTLTCAQQSAVLYGTCADTSVTQIRYNKIDPFGMSVINPPHSMSVPRVNDHFRIKLHIESPSLMNLYPEGYFGVRTIHVTPGDSVSFQIVPTKNHRYEIIFSGKNAAPYNYSQFMRKAFYGQQPYFKKGNDLNHYKQALLAYKKRQMDSLKYYTRDHVVSKSFIDYAKAEINNEYVHRLYIPLDDKLVSLHDLPSGYLLDANPEKNEISEAYKEALTDKYIYNYTDAPITDFYTVYTNIIHNFSGQDRAYLLSAMIGYYALQQKTEYHSELLRAIKEAPQYVQNPQYLGYIRRAEKEYSIINQPFPDSVLIHTYLRSYSGNKKITLKELLSRYRGKALYVDFWASWSGACRMDIARSRPARQYLAKKNIACIYISEDTDVKAWLKAAKEEGITQDQYLLENVSHSPLLKYLYIDFIPRYVLMDGKHDVIEPKAPRPDDSYFGKISFNRLKRGVQEISGKKKP